MHLALSCTLAVPHCFLEICAEVLEKMTLQGPSKPMILRFYKYCKENSLIEKARICVRTLNSTFCVYAL